MKPAEPVPAEPVPAEPVPVEPGSSKSAAAEPVASEPTAPGTVTFPLKDFFAMEIAGGEGTGSVTLDLADNHLNPNGVAHGAVAFTMMDTAMGAAVVSLLDEGRHCATVEIHTRFHRPATSGRLWCRAEVTTPGRRLMHVAARTVDDDDRLIASASASFIII